MDPLFAISLVCVFAFGRLWVVQPNLKPGIIIHNAIVESLTDGELAFPVLVEI